VASHSREHGQVAPELTVGHRRKSHAQKNVERGYQMASINRKATEILGTKFGGTG